MPAKSRRDEKKKLVAQIAEWLQENEESQRSLADLVSLHRTNVSRWLDLEDHLMPGPDALRIMVKQGILDESFWPEEVQRAPRRVTNDDVFEALTEVSAEMRKLRLAVNKLLRDQ